MSRYAHSTQTGKLCLVTTKFSILQNIRRTNIDRLVAISYQIPVVEYTGRTKYVSKFFLKFIEISQNYLLVFHENKDC